MEKMTFDGNFCDIAQCNEVPGGSFCEDGACSQKKVWERLKAYEDRGCEPEEVLPKDKADEIALKLMRLDDLESLCSYDRLRELAEADKDGRVVVLPCRVGDKVWFETYKNSARDCIGIQPHEVARISVDIIVPGEIVDTGIPVDQIGVSVFLSEAEAVAADAKPPAGNAILEV